jgi:hypothetical protein
VRQRNIFFSRVLIAVRQGRQRRYITAAGEEQLGRYTARKSKFYWYYLYNSKLTFAAMHPRRIRVLGRSFVAALAFFF